MEDMRHIDKAHGFMIDVKFATSAVQMYHAFSMIRRSYMASFGDHDRDRAHIYVEIPEMGLMSALQAQHPGPASDSVSHPLH